MRLFNFSVILAGISVTSFLGCGVAQDSTDSASAALDSNEQAANLCYTKGVASFDPGGLDTTGVLNTVLEGPATRAVLGTPSRTNPVPLALSAPSNYQRAELTFWYRGRVAQPVETGSGLTRYQAALKLHALNACNVIYVTWIFDAQRLLVQRKMNTGLSSSNDCMNRGYVTVADIPLAQAEPSQNSQHSFSATLTGSALSVIIDSTVIDLDPSTSSSSKTVPDATAFDGPPGVRTDNVDIEFVYRATNQPVNPTYFVATSATNGTGAQGFSNSCPFGE